MIEKSEIIELVNPKNGFTLDGDDLSIIWRNLDDLSFPDNDYNALMEDISIIQNAMNCEYGIDYGSNLNWDDVVIEMVEIFKNYIRDDVKELIEFLKEKYKNKN